MRGGMRRHLLLDRVVDVPGDGPGDVNADSVRA